MDNECDLEAPQGPCEGEPAMRRLGAELECGHQNRSGGAGAASLTCSCCQSLPVFLCQQFHKSLKRNLYYNQPQGRSKKGEGDSTALSFSDSVEVDVLIILIKGRIQGTE